MDGFMNGYQMIDSIVAVTGTSNYKDKRREQGTYRSSAKKKASGLSPFEEQLSQGMMIHTSGYGPNASKTEFFYRQPVMQRTV